MDSRKKNLIELNQPGYFIDVLASDWKPGYVLNCIKVLPLFLQEKKTLQRPSRLIKIRFEPGRHPE